MTDPLKMDLRSQDVLGQRINKLKELFPDIFTEGKIDINRLKEALGEEVDTCRERYGLTWAGKSEAIKNIQTQSHGTLLPIPEESVNFKDTGNLIIEGDNLEVLKLLQKSYHGKIRMIYIDPPYNTGNEFIYPDNFKEGLEDYLRYSGQVNGEGIKLSTNTETDGRFHSKWLNMMYPRLFLARNLLREDGVIFVSIDDNEVKNLRNLMDEIFGEENFAGQAIWQKKYSPQNDAKTISPLHEYICVYARNLTTWRPNLLPRTEEALARYKNPDNDPRGPWKAADLTSKTKAAGHSYPIISPTGKEHYPTSGRQWAPSYETLQKLLAENRIWFGQDGNNVPAQKVFLSEVQEGTVPTTLWLRTEVGDNQEAMRDLGSLDVPFDSPKPARLIRHMLKIGSSQDTNDIILDFFAGSGTTAQAVLEMNAEDEGNRKFILVQLPEPTGREDYPTIADITKERVRRVIEKLNNEDANKLDFTEGEKPDRGFKVFKLSSSNFRIWDGSQAAAIPDNPAEQTAIFADNLADQLRLFTNNLVPDRQPLDMLYEIILKAGFTLTAQVDVGTVRGQKFYSVEGSMLLICLEKEIRRETLRAMMELEPAQIVCLDVAFQGNDMLKTNTVLEMKSHNIIFHTV